MQQRGSFVAVLAVAGVCACADESGRRACRGAAAAASCDRAPRGAPPPISGGTLIVARDGRTLTATRLQGAAPWRLLVIGQPEISIPADTDRCSIEM